jgi:general secretion pathway protein A
VTDYLTFWQSKTAIFRRELAPNELFYSAAMRPKLERLLLQCSQPNGLILVVGPSGTGKSTVLKWIYDTLEVAKHEVLLTTLVRDETTMGWLTSRLAEFMGVVVPAVGSGNDLTPAMRRTAAAFDELIAEHLSLLVTIDAAHRLVTPESCGEISAYLNLQALAGSCVTFLLAGDQRLKHLILSIPELSTRVAFTLEIHPMTRTETADYIDHRLRHAGVAATFDSDAVALIFDLSSGIAASIDHLAESCLIEAAFMDVRVINRTVVQAAAAQIYGDKLDDKPGDKPSAKALGDAPTEVSSGTEIDMAKQQTILGTPSWLTMPISQVQPTDGGPFGSHPHDHKSHDAEAAGATKPIDSGIKLTSLFKSEPGRNRS